MESILVDPISHGVVQPGMIDFSTVQVIGLGGGDEAGGGAPAGDNNSFQLNNNGKLGGFVESDSTGVASLLWDPTKYGGSMRFGSGWGDIGLVWFDGSFKFDPGMRGTAAATIAASVTTIPGYLSTPAVNYQPGTVAALFPASPGSICCVRDGAAGLVVGEPLTGGGSTNYLVWFNGTEWTIIGT